MNRLIFLAFVLILLSVTSVVAQDVRYDFDRDAEFSKFKTYKWVDIEGSDHVDRSVEKQIQDALDVELAKKGLQKTEADSADLYVGYQTAITTKKQLTSYISGRGRGWHTGGVSSVTTRGFITTIDVGQLDVDMYESARKDLIWRGTASKTINPKAKPDRQQKDLTKAIQKLLRNYPPKKQ